MGGFIAQPPLGLCNKWLIISALIIVINYFFGSQTGWNKKNILLAPIQVCSIIWYARTVLYSTHRKRICRFASTNLNILFFLSKIWGNVSTIHPIPITMSWKLVFFFLTLSTCSRHKEKSVVFYGRVAWGEKAFSPAWEKMVLLNGDNHCSNN